MQPAVATTDQAMNHPMFSERKKKAELMASAQFMAYLDNARCPSRNFWQIDRDVTILPQTMTKIRELVCQSQASISNTKSKI